jgi:hypothetical protein
MQFTSKLSEAEYMGAYRLNCKSPYRAIANAIAYTVTSLFWIFLIASWIFKALHPSDPFLGQNVSAFQKAILPGAFGFLLWVLFFRVYTPYDTRRKFRKTRSFQIEVLNEINSEGLMQKTSEGSYGFSRWADFSHWRESEQMFIVVYPTGIFCMIPKSAVTSEQQNEVRNILTAALAKK